jgi:hypothetical protein
MNSHGLFFGVLAAAFAHTLSAQEVRLQLVQDGLSLQVSYDTIEGKTYNLQASADLVTWEDTGISKAGDGLAALHEVGPAGPDPRFYRVMVGEGVTDLAPTPTQMTEILVGTVQLGSYSFISPTEFKWKTEPGRWTYEKTGADTGTIVLTYDEDGNDPAVYREEYRLTFTSARAGTYLYYEYWLDRQISSSSGPFSLQ